MASIDGDEFDNDLFGTENDDEYFGFAGYDYLSTSLGNDLLNGGDDDDIAVYDVGLFTNGVFINNTTTAIGSVFAFTVDKRGFGTDSLVGVENFHGSNFDDSIYIGGLGGTYSIDRAGDDLVVASQDPNAEDDHFFAAGSGNDTLIGTVHRDRVDYSDDSFDGGGAIFRGVDVDLAAETAIDGWGDSDTLISIERVTGTMFGDIIRGNDERNDFRGLAGDDILDGRGHDRDRAEYVDDPTGVTVNLSTGTATDGWGGTDTLISIEQVRGSEFDDTLIGDDDRNGLEGEGGNDLIQGFGGDDNLEGDAGNDMLDGGEGFDVVGHFDDPNGVDLDLAAGTATDGWGDTDTLISIEGVDGSEHDDILRGDDGDNFLDGRQGDDLLEGRGGRDNLHGSQGNDTIDGGAGRDRAEYHRDDDRGGHNGVFVDLEVGTATDGFGDADTLISIEDVRGTRYGDTIIGNAVDNEIEGLAGDDTLSGGAGRDEFQGGAGNDIIDGGEALVDHNGGDRVRYDREHESGGTLGINVDLNTGIATDTFGDTDTLISIEEVNGSVFDDVITGSGVSEQLRGEEGNDIITGNDGNDDLSGGDGDDLLNGGLGGDFLQPGRGADTVIGGANGPLNEDDELSYFYDSRDNEATAGIAVTFTNETDGSVVDYGGDTDSFTGIERVRGTNNADSFIGADGRQQFQGFAGNDFFDGGAGDEDRIDYSSPDEELGATQGINVDMIAGTVTDTYGDTDTFINIEEIRGSRFDDTIFGDGSRNRLDGDDGNDLIDSFGGENNDLNGGRGNDIIHARGDGDWVGGGDGNDVITFYGIGGGANPGLGSDTIVGGTDGFFSIDYHGVGQDLIIDTALGTTTFVGSTNVDTFTNIPNIGGGEGDDILLGDDGGRQEFFTSLGNDHIDGRGGDRDWLIYDHEDESSVTVDFSDGTATGTFAGNDTFANIEAVRGTSGNDSFIGGTQEYTEYQGLDGVDSYLGGAGQDRLSFTFDDNRGGNGAIIIDIAAGEVVDGFGNLETFTGIEQVITSDYNDTLLGDDLANVLIGIGGDDILDGREGDDSLFAGGGLDTITGGAGSDLIGGRIWELDGDTITDLDVTDRIGVYNDDFSQLLAADLTINGDLLEIDLDGDGNAEATMIITNGYAGPVNSEAGPVGGPVAAIVSVENAGLFTAAVLEGNQSVEVTITRSGDVFSTVTTDVTVTGTGLAPADANDITSPFAIPQTVTFLPGQIEAVISVDIAADLDIEAAEDLAVTLSNPVSTGAGGAELDGAETFIRILNNDFPETVNITGEKAQEDSGTLTFTVNRTGDTTDAITVDWDIRSAGGLQGAEADDLVDGLPQSGSVVIPAGASEVTFDIAIAPDAIAELHDDVIATISDGGDWPAELSVGIAQGIGSIRNDDGIPPVLPVGATGSNFGDPHIVTLDGLAYDFQAVGEFTLIEATAGDPLNVQVRFRPVDGSQVASQTTAVATALGGARIVIDAQADDLVSIDGVAFDIATAVGGTSAGVGEIYFDGEAITLVYANGEQLRVDVFDGFLSTSVSIADGRTVQGLLGNADGNSSNDIVLPDGTMFAQPISFADLYGTYADAWRIEDTTSLFDYAPGQGTGDFTDLSFPQAGLSLEDFPVEIVAEAMSVAAGISDPTLRDAAVLDYLLTGEFEVITAASVIDENLDVLVEEVIPIDAPEIASGIGISVSDAEVSEGDSGFSTVTFTIYRTGDVSQVLMADYVVGGDVDAVDYEGAQAGQVIFEEGERTKTLSFEILGDDLAELDEALSVSFTLATADETVILSSIATTQILNDDLAPVAADDLFATDEDTTLTGNLFADNGTGVDSDDSPLAINALTLTDGTALTVGAVNDLGDGATLFVTSDGDMTFDPGEAYQPLGDGESDSFTFAYTLGSGADSDIANVTIDIAGIEDVDPEYNIIKGSHRSDFLWGTDGDDVFISKGGRLDNMVGGDGADLFVFGNETKNNRRDRDIIWDFDADEDVIMLAEGVDVKRVRDFGDNLVLKLEGRDKIYLLGDDLDFDDITIVHDTFEFV